jgi:hypothetical protein
MQVFIITYAFFVWQEPGHIPNHPTDDSVKYDEFLGIAPLQRRESE